MFGKLRVWDTEHNNGVLIYLLLAEHAIEIVADRGLAKRVDAAEWQRIAAAMSAAFKAGQFEAGLEQAVDAVDALLAKHFPLAAGEANPNELPDAPYVR
ncbi:MAG: TPM domain-containing protein, partial [Rhizobiales bacterium]|nr:TPM domain-containing protein [Rhizobacter sp.]